LRQHDCALRSIRHQPCTTLLKQGFASVMRAAQPHAEHDRWTCVVGARAWRHAGTWDWVLSSGMVLDANGVGG
jgi:hypothetical protein